jgi:protein SCO1/2
VSNGRDSARAAVLAVLAAATLGLAACSSGGGSSPAQVVTPPATSSGLRGAPVSPPTTLGSAERDEAFRSSAGGTTTLADLQRGRLMLLYFGYTNCPDICPTTMADLGQALRRLPPQAQAHTQVVFVTSDPDRDSPAVLAQWLANFDDRLPLPFVGLTATTARIDALAKSVGVPLSPAVVGSDGSVSVAHGTQTLAFLDGRAPLTWLYGTTVGDYAHDIDQLVLRVREAP